MHTHTHAHKMHHGRQQLHQNHRLDDYGCDLWSSVTFYRTKEATELHLHVLYFSSLFIFYFCLSVSLLKLHLNRTFTPMIQFAHCLGSYNPYSPRLHCTHRMKRKKIYWKSITVAFTKVYLTSIIITLPLLLQFLYSFSSCFFFSIVLSSCPSHFTFICSGIDITNRYLHKWSTSDGKWNIMNTFLGRKKRVIFMPV